MPGMIFLVAEFLAGDDFHLDDVLHDLRLDIVVDFAAVFIILRAGFGGNGETLGNRETETGHLRQIGALAAQQLAHFGVAFAEKVHILVTHSGN